MSLMVIFKLSNRNIIITFSRIGYITVIEYINSPLAVYLPQVIKRCA